MKLKVINQHEPTRNDNSERKDNQKTMKESFKDRLRQAMTLRNMKQAELSEITGIGKSAISQYVSGKYEPKQTPLYLIAKALDVNEAWLMGFDVPMEKNDTYKNDKISEVEVKKYPLLKAVDENRTIFEEDSLQVILPHNYLIDADFCLIAPDDSMTGAGIKKDDYVYVKSQPSVNNGQIAAIVCGKELMLRRIFKEGDTFILSSENPAYPPKVFPASGKNSVTILGLAVMTQSLIK